MSKKVAIDARMLGATTGRYMRKLIEHLHNVESPFEFTVLIKPSDRRTVEILAPSFSILEAPFDEYTLAEQKKLKRLLKQHSFDLVHFTMPNQPWGYSGMKITTVHDLTLLDHPPQKGGVKRLTIPAKRFLFEQLLEKVINTSEHIITPTNYVAEQIKIRYETSTPITTTYEAADPLPEPKKYDALTDSSFILYVGSAEPHKNLERLTIAFKQLQETHPKLKLVLAGKISSQHRLLLEKLKKGGGVEGIVLTDFVSDAQLSWLYKNCQCVVIPSLSEGFGLPGLEAMLAGAAVASSKATCLPEVYGEAAVYFDPQDPELMAMTINQLLTDGELRQKLQRLGSKHASGYSWQKMVRETHSLYCEILKT